MEDDNIPWDSEDDLEVDQYSSSTLATRNIETIISNGEASTSAGPSNSKVVDNFLAMGFSEQLVLKVIKEIGEDNTDAILDTLSTYSLLEESPEGNISSTHQQQECVNEDDLFSDYDENVPEDFLESDSYSWSDDDINISEIEIDESLPEHEKTILSLAKMGYTLEDASAAVDRCGPNASIGELTDFICAAQMAKTEAVFYEEEPKKLFSFNGKLKRKKYHEAQKTKKQKGPEEEDFIRLPRPMIGFGVPSGPGLTTHRNLPEAAKGPPYFYYENVALAPKGVWDRISRILFEVPPEFVDSKHFCAANRKRGYVHNLPINN